MPNARNAKSTREKAAALRQEQERQASRRRRMTVGISVIAVLAVIIGGFVLVRTLKNQQDAKVAAAAEPPANLYTVPAADGGVSGALYGKPVAKVTVVTFEDFQCPICKEFEQTDSSMLRSYADQGKIKLVYRPVAILDSKSSTNYSTRSASAAAAVLNVAPDKFIAYHDALYAAQPDEGSAGLPDSQLVSMAVTAGVPQASISSAITNEQFQGFVTNVTNDFVAKYTGTPTVLINGAQQQNLDAASLKTALDKAVAAAG